jgi:hypothetical protein
VRFCLPGFWFTISLHQLVSVSTDFIRHGTVSLGHRYLCSYNLHCSFVIDVRYLLQ